MKKCVLCGWSIPEGKGNDPFPVSKEEGAVVCNWCFSNIVTKAQEAVDSVMFDASSCTVEENEKIRAEKEAVND